VKILSSRTIRRVDRALWENSSVHDGIPGEAEIPMSFAPRGRLMRR